MKVSSYIQLSYTDIAWLRDNLLGVDDLTDKTHAFYSQPFKPELITELFEGWETTFSKHYKNGSMEIFYNDYHYWYGEGLVKRPLNCFHPRTLDDFITDCQRACIELEWKL